MIELTRSAPFRIAAYYAGWFALSVALLFGFVYWNSTVELTQQLQTATQQETQSLLRLYRERGWEALRSEVGERAQRGVANGPFYTLQDRDGRVRAGNIDPVTPFEGWKQIRRHLLPNQDDDSALVLLFGTRIKEGLLVVGRSLAPIDELQEVLLSGLGWTLGLTVVLALLGGIAMSRSALRRVEMIVAASNDIMEGNLARRLPVSGFDDEIDHLALTINRMLERIQALIEGLRQVSSDIAHDLRTPLGRLRQRLESARRAELSPENCAATLDRAVAEINTILETFSALLSIAQIESRARRSRFAVFDISALARDIVESFEAVAENQGQRITGRLAVDISLRGDRELLAQALVNLIENAIRHSPVGTAIEVTLEDTANGSVLGVSDTGPGIPAAEQENVLRRFYRLEKSRTTPGSGLGLALVKAIADLHDACLVLADNAPGLRVELHLPKELRS
ncbi:MAG: sensor histidine kinase [Sulfuricaulis sp.]